MLKVEKITNDALQQQTLILEDGTALTMTMYFVPMQYGWFIRDLSYGSWKLNGLRIVNSPNFLHQFRNEIPFGMGCFTQGKREPTQQDDFSSEASALYILTEAEVLEYAEYLRA